MRYESREDSPGHHRPYHSPARAGSAVAPGKRTLAMNVPRRAASSPGLIQMNSDLAADGKRAEHAASTEQWSDVTMRPDLYQQPVQQESASEARDPLASSGSGQPMPEGDASLDGAAIGMPYSLDPVQTECGECGGAKAGTGECPACKAIQAAATPSGAPQVVQRQCDPEIASCPLEEPGASPSPNASLEPNASSSPPNVSVEPPNQTTGPRYPNQTCTNEVLDALQAAMHAACDIGQSTCSPSKVSQRRLNRLTCDEVERRLQRNRECLDARIAIQDQCFGGIPDQRHAEQIEAARRSLEHCEILWNRNCRQQEQEQPDPVPSFERVLDVLVTLGLSIALVGAVIAALADPEPASKVALAVGSAALALIILQRLGIEPEEGFEA